LGDHGTAAGTQELAGWGFMSIDSDTFSSIVWAAALIGILISFYFAHLHRRRHTKRLLIRELLKRYFQNEMSADELGNRIGEIGDYYFMRSAELYSLVIAAFQGAVDERRSDQANLKEGERKLLVRLAALKKEFGLPDLYQIEGWRAWRE
jgi:hypothetical protein